MVGAALRVLRERAPTDQTLQQVTLLARDHAHWPTRLEATHTLSRYARPLEGAVALVQHLVELATEDRYAFVREAAIAGLSGSTAGPARAGLERARDTDTDGSVRRAAAAALQR